MNCPILLLLLCLTSFWLCQKSKHGFFRSYKNNRSWGTGSKGQAITDVTAVRMGRQTSSINSLASSMTTRCSCSDSEECNSQVYGTDGQTYSSVWISRRLPEETRRQLPECPAQTGDILPGALQVALQGDAGAGPLPGIWKQGHKLRNVCPWLLHLCPDSESPGHGLQWPYFLHQGILAKYLCAWNWELSLLNVYLFQNIEISCITSWVKTFHPY